MAESRVDRLRRMALRARTGGFRPVRIVVSPDVREALRAEYAGRRHTMPTTHGAETLLGLPLVVETRPAGYMAVEIGL